MTSIPASSSLQTSFPYLDPTVLMTLSFGGHNYQIFAYIEENNGIKTYLSSHTDPQAIAKIRDLTLGLLDAHDLRRQSLNEAPYDLKRLDAKGLTKADNTTISHDFLIQPLSPVVADQMTNAISSTGHPIQASTVKANDVWVSMEEIIRREMGRPNQSVQCPTSTNLPTSNSSTSSQPPMSQPLSQLSNSTLSQNSINVGPNSNNQTQIQIPSYQKPITASDLDLHSVNFDDPNWYEDLPERQKLRIVTDILSCRCPVGGIYQKVWNLFGAKARAQSTYVSTLLKHEKIVLSEHCEMLPSRIPPTLRQQASQFIETFYQARDQETLKKEIRVFMEKEFERKEQLLKYLREQAIAEGFVIENLDREWAQYHYLENTYRFIQALARWLDNE